MQTTITKENQFSLSVIWPMGILVQLALPLFFFTTVHAIQVTIDSYLKIATLLTKYAPISIDVGSMSLLTIPEEGTCSSGVGSNGSGK